MTILQAKTEYLNWKKGYFPAAAKSYGSMMNLFANFFDKSLENITESDISTFVEFLKTMYRPSYVRYGVAILKDFFRYYPGVINPHHIKNPRLNLPEVKYLTQDHFQCINNSLDEWNYGDLRAKLIHNMLWSTGIRISELCSINLSQISMVDRSMKIITKKSKKEGWIMWSEETHQLLCRFLGFRLCMDTQDDTLFGITPRQIERIVKQIGKDVGLDIHPHMYRHGKAHKALKDGATIDEIAFILRHSNPTLTKKMYLRLDKAENLTIMSKYA